MSKLPLSIRLDHSWLTWWNFSFLSGHPWCGCESAVCYCGGIMADILAHIVCRGRQWWFLCRHGEEVSEVVFILTSTLLFLFSISDLVFFLYSSQGWSSGVQTPPCQAGQAVFVWPCLEVRQRLWPHPVPKSGGDPHPWRTQTHTRWDQKLIQLLVVILHLKSLP